MSFDNYHDNRKSLAWKLFSVDPQGKRAKCSVCQKFYSLSNTGSLLRHFKSAHPSDFDKKHKVLWMLPTWQCIDEHAIPLEKYGISQNDGQKFINGSKFAIFYMEKFGKFPYFEELSENRPINGGLPQTGDISEHLRIAENNILESIPSRDFDGVAVIDLEHFRPNWELSWGKFDVYKKESIKLVRQKYPLWDKKQIQEEAKQQYESATRIFFVETIRLGKRLRPKAKWGYYLFPKCNNNVGQIGEKDCSQKFEMYNDNLDWLWIESTALFPSYYLHSKDRNIQLFNLYNFAALIMESNRIKSKYCPNCEIHMFTSFEYDPYNNPTDFYSKSNLWATLEIAMKMGVKSTVFWSTSYKIKNRCDGIKGYVEDTLGPYVDKTNRYLEKCRQKQCNGRGECYLPRVKK